jgi:hypothetical protein
MNFGRRAAGPSPQASRADDLPSGADLLPDAWKDTKAEIRAWNRARMMRIYPWWFRFTGAGITAAGVAAHHWLPHGGDIVFVACMVIAGGMTIVRAHQAGR